MARIVVIGQSGTGKSYGAGALIERVLDPEHPANGGQTFDIGIHFDYEDEERGLSDSTCDPLYQRFDVDLALANRVSWLKVIDNHRYLRIVPDMTVEEATKLYGVIAQAVMKICKDLAPELTAFVSCDEAGELCKQHSTPKAVLRMVTGGRKHGVECCHISQRPQQMHTTIISQADRRIYFRVSDSNDIDKINKNCGFNADELEDLPDRHCIIENKSTGDTARECTNDWTRIRPHHAKDDGIADAVLPV